MMWSSINIKSKGTQDCLLILSSCFSLKLRVSLLNYFSVCLTCKHEHSRWAALFKARFTYWFWFLEDVLLHSTYFCYAWPDILLFIPHYQNAISQKFLDKHQFKDIFREFQESHFISTFSRNPYHLSLAKFYALDSTFRCSITSPPLVSQLRAKVYCLLVLTQWLCFLDNKRIPATNKTAR